MFIELYRNLQSTYIPWTFPKVLPEGSYTVFTLNQSVWLVPSSAEFLLYGNISVPAGRVLFKSLEFKNNPSINELSEKIYDLMTGSKGFKYVVGLGQLALLKKATYTTPDTHEKIEPTEEIQKAAALVFSKYIINKL